MHKLLSLCLPGNTSSGSECLPPIRGIPSGGIHDIGGVIISNGIIAFLVMAAILALLFIIYSGIQWITSEGDKGKIQAARGRLTYAIIGLVIMFLGYFVISLVGNIIGVKLFGS